MTQRIFRVENDKHVWHMTREELEESGNDIKVINMLGYCNKCENFSTESDIPELKDNIVCVLCGDTRYYGI